MYAFHGLAFYKYFRIKRKTGKSEEEEEDLQKEGKKRRNGREREKVHEGRGEKRPGPTVSTLRAMGSTMLVNGSPKISQVVAVCFLVNDFTAILSFLPLCLLN